MSMFPTVHTLLGATIVGTVYGLVLFSSELAMSSFWRCKRRYSLPPNMSHNVPSKFQFDVRPFMLLIFCFRPASPFLMVCCSFCMRHPGVWPCSERLPFCFLPYLRFVSITRASQQNGCCSPSQDLAVVSLSTSKLHGCDKCHLSIVVHF